MPVQSYYDSQTLVVVPSLNISYFPLIIFHFYLKPVCTFHMVDISTTEQPILMAT